MYNQSVQVQEKPTAAYYLALIGGIIGLIVGIFTLLLFVGIWIIAASAVVLYSAQKLMQEPMEHTKWGIIIIVFSILGGGTILGLIGGILALVYSPRPVGSAPNAQPYSPYSQPAPQQPITRICPQCGRVLDEDVKFCPHCGRQLS